MSITIVEPPMQKSAAISVKPYFNPNVENLGLEKYGMVLTDGAFQEEDLACIELNGIRRYVTGLNEFAPEIKLIQDEETRQAKIREIRKKVSELEKELAANIVAPDDPEFWNKIKLLSPSNDEFWGKIKIRCGNEPLYLDPRNPFDAIKISAIEAGGFSLVAKSYEEARSKPNSPKFYLDKLEDTISTKTELTKLRNKALSELQNLYEKNTNKLKYVAKIVDINSVQYRKSTPVDIIYDNMDKYINGLGSEPSVKRAPKEFLDAAKLDMETLKIKCLVKDATFYKILAFKGDGFIYHLESQTMLGRNASDCLEFLKNPLNEQIFISLTKKIENYWNQ